MKAELIAQFAAIVGDAHALTDGNDIAPHLVEWRKRWTGTTPLVLKPGSTEEVSHILRLAHETRTPVVPQGGNTGLVGGQIPDWSGSQIIVNLSRMNQIRSVDAAGRTIIADAGATLYSLQMAANDADCLFPLSLASEGSCQIGGNLAANAGGTGALAYGVARDLVLGLEVVMPNGDVLDDLSVLKKDNTGYALRHLFVGSEGTLGIITAASLKLFAKPKGYATMHAACPSPAAALELLHLAQDRAGASLTAFELMADEVIAMAVEHMDGVRNPVETRTGWAVLVEISSLESNEAASAVLESIAEAAFEQELIVDAALAQNDTQRQAFWHLRESLSESQLHEGVSVKHDISVPVPDIPAFVDKARADVEAVAPGTRFCIFGHMGDGNLHYNITQPKNADREAFLALAPAITEAVHNQVRAFSGSISAEHGVGQMKKDELAATKSPVALGLMRSIKRSFDPHNIMNPGKVLDP